MTFCPRLLFFPLSLFTVWLLVFVELVRGLRDSLRIRLTGNGLRNNPPGRNTSGNEAPKYFSSALVERPGLTAQEHGPENGALHDPPTVLTLGRPRPPSPLREELALSAPALAPPKSAAPSEPRPPARLRLPYLDGLRGLAALFVVLHHAYYNVVWDKPDAVPGWVRVFSDVLLDGHYGVDVFIVLSGYCLMLPLSRSGGPLPGGVRGFFLRRARRILPAYFAALALCLALYAAVPALREPGGTRQDLALPVFDGPSLLAHALLAHNLDKEWANTIDPPMWSVATEWQIYFLFALLLVPLWRRLGIFHALVVAVAVGCAASLLTDRFAAACFWFSGLFALGMLAAEVNFSPARWAAFYRRAVPWGTLAAVLVIGGVAGLRWGRQLLRGHLILTGFYVGLATMVLLVSCTRAALGQPRPRLLRFLESRPLALLGAISYSLYLVHWPILALLQRFALDRGFGTQGCLLLLMAAGVPLSLAAAYLCYLAFERPFLRGEGGRVDASRRVT
jgi:peptidoglycan/LPS O-acetylase OafA/YrhL